ncbi:MAG: C10 family peptidase, partial [Bacteroidales bacterium]|nr:C10 family peptidase [Bacteroidales bacterium]
MKRIYLLVAMFLLSLAVFGEKVSQSTAEQVAKAFWKQKTGVVGQFTDLTSQTEFTEFYIFSENGGGFVIVAGDDVALPILGYSTEDNFRVANMPENILEWFRAYNHDISYAVANGFVADAETQALWTKLLNEEVLPTKASRSLAPLVATKWNQDAPYNNFCPMYEGERVVTGCVATAMAQLLKYWNYPISGSGSQSYTCTQTGYHSVNFANTTYDWANMLNVYSSSATTAQNDAVATLMYHCGVAVKMDYNTGASGGSGAMTNGNFNGTAEYAFKTYFTYSSNLHSEYKESFDDESVWVAMLKVELDNYRPIVYAGSGEAGGHCFICDGYDNSNNFHFNWGWSGSGDGYYALNALTPGTGGAGSGDGLFSNGQRAIVGIEPISILFVTPSNLEISGLGGSESFVVRSSLASSANWTATCDQSWLTLSQTSGAGSGAQAMVTVSAAQNNSADARTATITITQGTSSATVTVTQPSGFTNPAGCYGNVNGTVNYYHGMESGNQVLINSQAYGYFESGHIITSVKFTTFNPSNIGSSTTDYPNMDYTIKIYEGGHSDATLMSEGYSFSVDEYRGNLVYSQAYTSTAYGEQNVVLNTPYIIDANTVFWIAVEAEGDCILSETLTEYGDAFPVSEFSGSGAAANGKYFYTNYYDGMELLNTNTSAFYADAEGTQLQLYTIEYLLYFCTEDPGQFAVSPSTLDFDAIGGTLPLTVRPQSNLPTNWTATSSESWLTLSQTSGAGSGAIANIYVTAEENTDYMPRTATITVTQGTNTAIITVNQQAAVNSDCIALHEDRFTAGDVCITASSGYVCGSNYFGDAAKAEHFEIDTEGDFCITSVSFKYKVDGTNGNVVFKIWSNNSGLPGTELASKSVTLSELYGNANSEGTGIYTWYFPQTLNVEDDFFAGYDVTGTTSYIGLYSTDANAGYSDSYELWSGSWYDMSSNWGGSSFSMYIIPTICPRQEPSTDLQAFFLSSNTEPYT